MMAFNSATLNSGQEDYAREQTRIAAEAFVMRSHNLAPKDRVTQEEINELLSLSDYEEHVFWGKELVVSCKLPCGFTVTGRGACLSPQNFDLILGRKVAREQIEAQLWQLEGYRKQLALGEKCGNDSRILVEPELIQSYEMRHKELLTLADSLARSHKTINDHAKRVHFNQTDSAYFILGKVLEISEHALTQARMTQVQGANIGGLQP